MFLEPEEQRHYDLEIGALTGSEALKEFAESQTAAAPRALETWRQTHDRRARRGCRPGS